MAGQKIHQQATTDEPMHPNQKFTPVSDESRHLSQASLGSKTQDSLSVPLDSIRLIAQFLAQCLKQLSKDASRNAPFLRDVWVRFPPALLFGVLAAIAGGLLLPDENVVTAIALSSGVVLATWVLSFLYPLYRVWNAFLWISSPLFSYLLVEILIGNIRFGPFLLYLSDIQSFLNLCWYYLIAALLYAITGRTRLSAGICAVLGWAWGNLNSYLLLFRGRILFPADIHALRTAAMVTADYNWKPSLLQVISCVWLLCFLLSLTCGMPSTRTIKGRKASGTDCTVAKRPRRLARASLAIAFLVGIYLFFGTSLVARLGVHPSQWFTQQNGVLLNFMINLKNSHVTKPPAYASLLAAMNQVQSATDVQGTLQLQSGTEHDALNQSGVSPAVPPQAGTPLITTVVEGKRPNIIVIMNEAFSDMSVLGNIRTNADPLSFLHSQTENTISGNAYSSVIGGNTANSEYEFLTGNTMAFLPAGMVSYQAYTAPGDYALTGQLNQYGYRTIALHPYERAGWNRVQVYRNYGFSEMHFVDEFKNKQYVRNYVSDRSNYAELIRRFDAFREQDAETPLFFLNVTMQNHGGYRQTWERLAHKIHVEESDYTASSDVEGENAEINQYLSLIKEADDAYKSLIEHFRKVEEPTIILLFGDHQPKLSDDFYRNVLGKSPETYTAAETQRMYTVPFALWANYDIPEAQDVRISLNYLASLLLETADLPLTPYQTFLSDMRNVVPVINSMGMCGEDGAFVTQDSSLTETGRDYVTRYRAYQYNGIFDRKNRVESFFHCAPAAG